MESRCELSDKALLVPQGTSKLLSLVFIVWCCHLA